MVRSRSESHGGREGAQSKFADPYAELNIAEDATTKEISVAFKRLAGQYHPDRNPGDKAAEQKFKRISSAFDILKNPEKRAILHMARQIGITYEDAERDPAIRSRAAELAASQESTRAARAEIKRLEEQMQERRRGRQSPRGGRAEALTEDPETTRRREAAERQALLDEEYARSLASRSDSQPPVPNPELEIKPAPFAEPPNNLPTGRNMFENDRTTKEYRDQLAYLLSRFGTPLEVKRIEGERVVKSEVPPMSGFEKEPQPMASVFPEPSPTSEPVLPASETPETAIPEGDLRHQLEEAKRAVNHWHPDLAVDRAEHMREIIAGLRTAAQGHMTGEVQASLTRMDRVRRSLNQHAGWLEPAGAKLDMDQLRRKQTAQSYYDEFTDLEAQVRGALGVGGEAPRADTHVEVEQAPPDSAEEGDAHDKEGSTNPFENPSREEGYAMGVYASVESLRDAAMADLHQRSLNPIAVSAAWLAMTDAEKEALTALDVYRSAPVTHGWEHKDVAHEEVEAALKRLDAARIAVRQAARKVHPLPYDADNPDIPDRPIPQGSVPGAENLNPPSEIRLALEHLRDAKTPEEEAAARDELARLRAEKFGASGELATLVRAEGEVEKRDAEYYKQTLFTRAKQWARGDHSKAIAALEADMNRAALAYDQKLSERLPELQSTHADSLKQRREAGAAPRALDQEKVTERYRRMVTNRDVIVRGEQARAVEKARVLSEKEAGMVANGMQWLGQRNAALEKSLGKNGARAARILASAFVGAGIVAVATPVGAVGVMAALGQRALSGAIGTFGGAALGMGGGKLYELTRGKKVAAQLKTEAQKESGSVEDIVAKRVAYQKGSPEAIARGRKYTEMIVAALSGAGLSLSTAYALGVEATQEAATKTARPAAIAELPPASPPSPHEHIEPPAGVQQQPAPEAIPPAPTPPTAEGPAFTAPIPSPEAPPAPTETLLPPDVHPPPTSQPEAAPGPGEAAPATPPPLGESPITPVIEVKRGFGYESMIRRLRAELIAQDPDPQNYIDGSDAQRLVNASPAELNSVIYKIEQEHGFVLKDGKSARVSLGQRITLSTDGRIEVLGPAAAEVPMPEALPAAPLTLSTQGDGLPPPDEVINRTPDIPPVDMKSIEPGGRGPGAGGIVRAGFETNAPPHIKVELPTTEPVPPIAVEAAKGEGYDTMIKRIWVDVQGKGMNPNMYPVGSDLHRLLIADGRSIDRVARLIAADPKHQLFGAPSAGLVLELGADGNLHVLAPGEAPVAPPLTIVTPAPSPVPEGVPSAPEAPPNAASPERTGVFTNDNGVEVDPSVSAIYQGSQNDVYVHGGEYAAQLEAAKAYAMEHKGVKVWVQGEKPIEQQGVLHPWAFGVIRKGLLPRVTIEDMPVPGAVLPGWQIGAIMPGTFTKRLTPPSVVS